jgi:uncharacterized membrane protein HdeD (DUF308 family)
MASITANSHQAFGHSSPASNLWSVLMILAGVAAIAVPFAAGIGIATAVAWLIIVGGVLHLAHSFSSRGIGAVAWHVLIGVIYIAGGGYLALHPALNLVSLTIFVAVLFLIEAGMLLGAFFTFRRWRGAWWFLADAVLTLALAVFILITFPFSAAWAIGTLVGINLIISGVTRLLHPGPAIPLPAPPARR